jgi:Flp pilus assembly protein TadG
MQRLRRLMRDESGNASLEFVTTGMILLVPLVYLVLAVAAIQAGSLAIEGAARQAVRVFVQADTTESANAKLQRAVQFALADYGLDGAKADVSVACSPTPTTCLKRLGLVTVTIRVSVALPLVPAFLTSNLPLSVPLEATATERVSRFRGTA